MKFLIYILNFIGVYILVNLILSIPFIVFLKKGFLWGGLIALPITILAVYKVQEFEKVFNKALPIVSVALLIFGGMIAVMKMKSYKKLDNIIIQDNSSHE